MKSIIAYCLLIGALPLITCPAIEAQLTKALVLKSSIIIYVARSITQTIQLRIFGMKWAEGAYLFYYRESLEDLKEFDNIDFGRTLNSGRVIVCHTYGGYEPNSTVHIKTAAFAWTNTICEIRGIQQHQQASPIHSICS